MENNVEEKKPFYKSWTVWFNVILILVDAINQISQFVPMPAGFLTMVGALGNLVLRFKTFQGIK
jgi:Mg2+/citrate symporter